MTTADSSSTVPYHFIRPREPTREMKVWEAARATAAAPPYFKPYVKPESGTAFADGAIHNNCPVRIADSERKLLWEDVSDWPADMLLSLGTGLSGVDRGSKSSSKFYAGFGGPIDPTQHRNVAGLSYLWRTASSIIDDQLNCEKIWKDYQANVAAPSKAHGAEARRRNIRLNITFDGDRARLDDISCLDRIEQEAQRLIQEDKLEITEIAHRLVASCFYFDKTGCPPSRVTGEYVCYGKVALSFEAEKLQY